ncbi:MAG TPA: tetratricopeptide repeat protein [Phycisphaerales bacterium]|nr:tetratricopeptide repeat protein [Phycisphaerales bacterium]
MKTEMSKIRFIVIFMAICSSAYSYAAEQKVQTQNNEIISKSRILQKQFIQNDIISLQVDETTANQTELQRIIDEMQKLQMPSLYGTEADDNESDVVDDPAVETQSQLDTAPPANVAVPETQPKNTGNISRRIFDKLLENPEKIVDPLSTAQALFIGDKMADAAKFYKIALQRTDKIDSTDSIDEIEDASDRQWILFQIGNCLRKDDPDEAYKYYQQLIEEYPSSGWNPAALACQQVITWYKQTQPSNILEQYTSDPNSI